MKPRKMSVELVPWKDGDSFEWRSQRKPEALHQGCALAGLIDAVSVWTTVNGFEMQARPFHVYGEPASRTSPGSTRCVLIRVCVEERGLPVYGGAHGDVCDR